MTRLFYPALVLAMLATSVCAQDARYPRGNAYPGNPGNGYANNDGNVHYGWADVLRVDPVYVTTRTEVPQQQCYNQQVVRKDPGNSTASTILGAVVGGVLGSTIGKGDGRRAATVVGAVAGGAVGNRVSDHGGEYATTQTQCRPVSAVTEQRQLSGYDVEYRYRGEVYMSRLNYDPGDRLRVRVSVEPAD